MTRKLHTSSFPKAFVLVLATSIAVTACGGGGDDAIQAAQSAGVPTTGTPPAAAPSTPPTPTGPPASVVAPACSGCGAIDANTYAGTGIGVWQNTNATGAAVDMPVNISGLTGQDVTLVFTNQTATAQPMPTIALTSSSYRSIAASELRWDDGTDAIRHRIAGFNREGWPALAGSKRAAPSFSMVTGPSRSVVNDVRTWYHEDNSAHSATLVRQLTATDGGTVNFWVEDAENEPTKVNATIVDTLANGFVPSGKIYDMLKSVGGPVWGPHAYSNLISGTGQPIDIVILNFDKNATPFGLVGYFYARNTIKKDPSTNPFSNESVSLYLDSETLYLGGPAGMKSMLLTMAHEGMHMQNFYRRGVVGAPSFMFDTWLEEASAMMMEDFASQSIDPTYNAIRDVRFPDFIDYEAGSYNCSLLDWTPFAASCDSYSVSGSLGGFLDRQLGLGFYKNLLANMSTTDSVEVLDAAIRSVAPTSGLGEQLRRFAATSASLMKNPSPAGFGFPARADGPFILPLIEPQALLPSRTLTQSVPTTLQPYASLPVVRRGVTGTYSETVKVPAGSTLSVVVQ